MIAHLQTGQKCGGIISSSVQFLLSFMVQTIYGITSQLLCTRTKSLFLICFVCIKSKLWRLTLEIVAQLSWTGSMLATGVMIHVLHTWKSTDLIWLAACCAGNLYAIAHLGWCSVPHNISRIQGPILVVFQKRFPQTDSWLPRESSRTLITNQSKSISCSSRNCFNCGSKHRLIICSISFVLL